MPNFPVALISFGKFIGLMSPDDSGVLQWTWFADPKGKTFESMLDNRQYLGRLLRALLDRDDTAPSPHFGPDEDQLQWEAKAFGPAEAGLIWNETTGELQIGLGALGKIPIAGKQLDLSVLARMIKFTADEEVSPEFGRIVFSAGFPVPDFLHSASLDGNYEDDLSFYLTVVRKLADGQTDPGPNDIRVLDSNTSQLPWDVARIGTFVLRTWLREKAQQSAPGSFFSRMDDHFFPMLGDPQPNPIQPFPVFAAMGSQPTFDTWLDSILSTDANASAALTFLWHLRALITGNSSPNILGGSRWFPLISEPGQYAGTPPAQGFSVELNGYPPAAPVTGAWLGVRESPAVPGATELVVDLRNGQPGPQGLQTIILLRRQGSSFTRPGLPTGNAWSVFAGFLQGMSPLNAGGGQITFDAATGKLNLITADELGDPTPDGAYSMTLLLQENAPVAYRVDTPLIGMEFPPNAAIDDPKELFKKLVDWIVSLVIAEAAPNDKFAQLAETIGQLVIDKVKGNAVDPKLILAALAAAISDSDSARIEFGPLSIGVSGATITPHLGLGPIQPGEMAGQQFPVSIGKATLSATLDLNATDPFQGFDIKILDLRLGASGETTGAGLVASLIPDMRDMPGFMLNVTYNPGAPHPFAVQGGGKIPVQQTIGPLEVVALLVDVRENSLTVGIDLSFELAIIKVAAYELGVRFKFDGSSPEVFLHGLGLSFDGGAIKLAGMFAEVAKEDGPSDYVGGAVVSIANMFQLSAIGAYTQVDGDASLFIFAALIAPLGGPPWFFVTGIAGGFGYNRTLPPSGRLGDNPFIKVLRGEISVGGGDAASLAKISALFAAKKGIYWIAAGIKFTAFGFIQGEVIVAVQFGAKFSLQILGLARFGIPPIAYFELGIEITADEDKFLLQAGLSRNSYIIHPDIFSLRGDFALGIWYGAPNEDHAPAGDFILSIGGYHPYFKKPDHYPELGRVGVKCVVYGFVRLSVEAFFACTPQALMAGVSVSLSAEFAGIGAGLDVYVDVLIIWDPFHLNARMGVVVWFEFLGRHEIGVALEIWTPDFGGIATIDLALVSFDVDFGAKEAQLPAPLLHQFMTRQLGTPAEQGPYENNHFGAILKAFNASEDEAGLFKLDITWGRATKKQSASKKQEGLTTPVPVNAEFGFTLRTRLPLKETEPGLQVEGEVDLPLCHMMDMHSALNLELKADGVNNPSDKFSQAKLHDYYPAANFGDTLGAAQADDLLARNKVALVDSGKPTIALTDGIVFDCKASPEGLEPPPLAGLREEDSREDEEYPLPLGIEQPLPASRGPKSIVYFGSAIPAVKIKPKVIRIGREAMALSEIQSRTWGPLFVFEYAGDVQRLQVGGQIKGLVYTVQPQENRGGLPGGQVPAKPVIAVPHSPKRRPELFGVNLRVAAPRAPIRLDRGRLENFTRAKNFSKSALTGDNGSRDTFVSTATVEAGKAITLDLRGGRRAGKPQLELSGSQTVRVIFQGGAEDLIGDRYVTGGATLSVPPRARRITLIGEGMHAPVTETSGEKETLISVREALGVEHDTTLFALGRRAFAAHGCVFVANVALPFAARPMDSVPGFKLLRAASNFTVHWPAVRAGCLILTVEPIGGGAPSSALNEVRWLSAGAELGGLSVVAGPSATALVMDFTAANEWSLEVDLGVKWRVTGVVVVQKPARDMCNWLRSRTAWDIVDDRLQVGAELPSTEVVLEVKQ